jgi:hypothetical protein
VETGVVDRETLRRTARWWEWSPRRLETLEGASLREDRTITRLGGDEIERNPHLRGFVEAAGIEPGDLLVYEAAADGAFGRFRLAAIFLFPPDIDDPRVYCLDGPLGGDASTHRNGEVELCLWYKDDPDERRWKSEDRLLRLFDLARRHVTGEHIWRMTGCWPIEEAPHGETEPAPPDPSLALPALRKPGRNEPCSCGSGRKAKRCCWR